MEVIKTLKDFTGYYENILLLESSIANL